MQLQACSDDEDSGVFISPFFFSQSVVNGA